MQMPAQPDYRSGPKTQDDGHDYHERECCSYMVDAEQTQSESERGDDAGRPQSADVRQGQHDNPGNAEFQDPGQQT
jgi:hypothetical protein